MPKFFSDEKGKWIGSVTECGSKKTYVIKKVENAEAVGILTKTMVNLIGFARVAGVSVLLATAATCFSAETENQANSQALKLASLILNESMYAEILNQAGLAATNTMRPTLELSLKRKITDIEGEKLSKMFIGVITEIVPKEEWQKMYVNILRRTFNEDEMRVLIWFYESPLAAKLPSLMAEGSKQGIDLMKQHQDTLGKAFMEKFEKEFGHLSGVGARQAGRNDKSTSAEASAKLTSYEEFRDGVFKEPMYKALFDLYPERITQILREAHSKVKSGMALLEAGRDLNTSLGKAVAERWPQASEAALDLYIDYKIRLIEDNYKQYPKNVLLRLNDPAAQEWHSLELDAKLPNYPQKIVSQLYEQILRSKGDKVSEASLKKGENVFSKIMSDQLPSGGIQLLAQTPLPQDPVQYRRACEMHLALYKAVKLHPEKYDVVRYLIAP